MKNYYLLLLSLVVVGTACTKKEDVKPLEKSKMEFIAGNSYIWNGIGGNGDLFEFPTNSQKLEAALNIFLKDCQTDDIFTFGKDGKITIDANIKKCDPKDPEVETGGWALISNEDSLLIQGGPQSNYTRLNKLKLRSINENGFTLESTIKNKDGSTSALEVYFRKK